MRSNGHKIVSARLFRTIAICLASGYAGFLLGFQQGLKQSGYLTAQDVLKKEMTMHKAPVLNKIVCPETAATAATAAHLQIECPEIPQIECTETAAPVIQEAPPIKEPLFPRTVHSYASGMSMVSRWNFAQKYDTGVPLLWETDTNRHVLILHADKAMPRNASSTELNTHLSVEQATENCNHMSLILTQPERTDQCIAIMGQYNSYHVFKFMRTNNAVPLILNETLPLKLVKRGTDLEEDFKTRTPPAEVTRQFWNFTLTPYLLNLQNYLDKVKPLAEKVAYENNVIVMVCNLGQSELLMNFVCHAKSRGLDLSAVLVFATDQETLHLSEGLGLTTFYDEQLFHQIPKSHAALFADDTYKNAIFSKVYCVHLLALLGYNYLFQDVDLVWYRHPFDYFLKEVRTDFDMYMQNDGNYGQFYMPYAANTGFYYVRNNNLTKYFNNHFLVSGDLIYATRTHQAPFVSVMSEHASLHGLKVKVLDGSEFPGGLQYHKRHTYMKHLLKLEPVPQGVKVDPWIFHMSWTWNKDYKLQFMKQMGIWHLKVQCLPPGNVTQAIADYNQTIEQFCCSAEPLVTCYFRDLPSIIPCHDSPLFNQGWESFHPEPKL